MYIAPGRGRQPTGDKTFMTTERPFFFTHILQVSKDVFKIWLYTLFLMIYTVFSPRARAENPLGTNCWCQLKALITSTICCKFQTNLFEFWFYTHFLMFFPHVYSPGARADNPLWTKSWCQQKSLVTLPICCKFQKKYLWSPTLYIIFHVFIHVYSTGAGADNPLGSEF